MTKACAAVALCITLVVAGLSPTAGAVPLAGGWTGDGATVTPLAGPGPNGTDAVEAALLTPTATVARALPVQAGGPVGGRGWVRQVGGHGARAQLAIATPDGTTRSSPVVLSSVWQAVGVIAQAPAGSQPVLSVVPAAGTQWPQGTRIDIAAAAADASPSVTAKVPGTRTITLNGQLFNGHGYLYWPTPIGGPGLYGTLNDPLTCQSDAQLLQGAGVNLVQVPWDDEAANSSPELFQCLDAFWAHGIGVAWLVYGLFALYSPTDAGTAEWQAQERAVIALVGSHPATYFYLYGNEIDYRNPTDGGPCFFDNIGGPCTQGSGHQLQQLATLSHQLDPNHLVSTKICCNYNVVTPTDVPALDFWSVDRYGSTSFGNLFTDMKTRDPNRPVFLAEFGNDHLHCNGVGSVNVNGGATAYTCPLGSYEDTQSQNTANTAMWQEIIANQSTASNAQGATFGGTAFMFSDLWWFDGFNACGSTASHDVCNGTLTSYGDGRWASEWAGNTYAQLPSQAGGLRVTTPAFSSAAKLFTGASFPTVGNTAVSNITNCSATVTWTTATPSPTYADWTHPLIVNGGNNGELLQDNTIYDHTTQNDTPATTHTIHLTGLFNNSLYRVVPRGIDAAFHTDSPAPIEFRTHMGDECPIP